MIISKTPLRLTLGGGGSDLPCYSGKFGGFIVTCTLDRYVYVLVKSRFERALKINYSLVEVEEDVNRIKHPVVREGLKLLGLKDHLEIISIADLPAQTGLGSSGSFTVGLLNSLHAFNDEHVSRLALAKEAAFLNMNILGEPCGVQDTYIAACGGFNCLIIDCDGGVKVEALRIKADVVRELENNLLFFYTGLKRSADQVLTSQLHAIQNDAVALEAMHHIREIGYRVKRCLEEGDVSEFGRLQHEHWLEKKRANPEASSAVMDRLYTLGVEAGAVGGKNCGAGGGGFLMFYCEDGKEKVRKIMMREGLEEVRLLLGCEGSKVVIDF